MDFPERLALLRGKQSRSLFAKELGINENTLRNYEKGLSLPNIDVAARICQIYGANSDWLLTGEGPMRKGEGQATSGPPLVMGQACDPDLVMVPKVRARLNAGGGSLETSDEEEGRYAFRSKWIRRKGQPGRMVLMDVAGDSMEPDIRDKDVVLIDQSQNAVIAGAIYAVGIDEEVLVKYVDKEPGKYILRSANERYRPIEIDLRDESQNVRIIGRVVWWCREAR